MVIYSLTHSSSLARNLLAIGRHGRCIIEHDETTQCPKTSIALLANIIALKCLNFYLFTQSVPVLSSMFVVTICAEFGLGLIYSFLNKNTENGICSVSFISSILFKIEAMKQLGLTNPGKVNKYVSLLFASLLINIAIITWELILPKTLINARKYIKIETDTKRLLDSLRTQIAGSKKTIARNQIEIERLNNLDQTKQQEIARLRAENQQQNVWQRELNDQHRQEIARLHGIHQQEVTRLRAENQILQYERARLRTENQQQRTPRLRTTHEQPSNNQPRITTFLRQVIQPIPDELERDSVFSKYICAISLGSMTDPVMDPTNHHTLYERSVILEAVQRDPRSPYTRNPLYVTQLIELPHLRALIQDRLEWYSRQN